MSGTTSRHPSANDWAMRVEDAQHASVKITGEWIDHQGSDTVVVVVHGLGGSIESYYMRRMGIEIARRGWSCLLLNTRGADRLGEDIGHAGLTDDIHAAITSFEVYRRRYVLGFSMGGHLALHYATESRCQSDGVAVLSAPLDLRENVEWLDSVPRYFYRRSLLRGLREIHEKAVHRGRVSHLPSPRVRSLRTWDAETVVPRFGYKDVEHYYESTSVGPRLSALRIPTLYMGTQDDPMVPYPSIRPWISDAPMETRWLAGGHVWLLGDNGRPQNTQALDWFGAC